MIRNHALTPEKKAAKELKDKILVQLKQKRKKCVPRQESGSCDGGKVLDLKKIQPNILVQ